MSLFSPIPGVTSPQDRGQYDRLDDAQRSIEKSVATRVRIWRTIRLVLTALVAFVSGGSMLAVLIVVAVEPSMGGLFGYLLVPCLLAAVIPPAVVFAVLSALSWATMTREHRDVRRSLGQPHSARHEQRDQRIAQVARRERTEAERQVFRQQWKAHSIAKGPMFTRLVRVEPSQQIEKRFFDSRGDDFINE